MSRSYKKHPFHSVTTSGANAGIMKLWKKECNRKVRKCDFGKKPSEYKKIESQWNAPNDGKIYNPKFYKAYRK